MKEYYDMLLKRKSVRRFDKALHISAEELDKIKQKTRALLALVPEIQVKFKIVKKEQTTSKRGEYCLLLYSEKKEHYLLNAGYLLEQMDLFLASMDIGVCWYGMAKPKADTYDGLDYVIMLAFGKSRSEDFRGDLAKCRRKSLEQIWKGKYQEIAAVVRYAPSACNSQPWRVECDGSTIKICRATGFKAFIPATKLAYYNSIDMGIFLCFLEVVLEQKKNSYHRALCAERTEKETLIHIAEYTL